MNTIFNPYLPSYEYIPDGEPHIFDNRLYIFGSHDRFDGDDYCQNNYVCWSAPINDLSSWTFHGEIYNKAQHPHSEERMLLFAPDVIKGHDGRYYLYYSMAHSSRMSVAVCDTPDGHYKYYGDVTAPDGHVYGINANEYLNFDPGVFMDDDGIIYLYSGFFPQKTTDEHGRLMDGAFVCRLHDDMLTMYELPHIIIPRDFPCPKDAGFFEASSMRKINGMYYFIYSARINGLHYATSNYPDHDFVYGGRIHSTSDVGLRGYTIDNTSYPNGNTHGSIINLNGSYYIFDHRYTNNSSYCRQGVAEKINIDTDGHIKQTESTSCGLNNAPLSATGTYPAYIACYLKNLRLNSDMPKDISSKLKPFLTQDGPDRDYGDIQYITNFGDGCMVGYKYFDFAINNQTKTNNKGSSIRDNYITIKISIRGNAIGKLWITTDMDYANLTLNDYKKCGCTDINISSSDWCKISIDALILPNVYPLYFVFEGSGTLSIREFSFNYCS